jgi:hypothetical protein
VDEFKELDLGFTPDTGAPHPVLLQTEFSATLVFTPGKNPRMESLKGSDKNG